MKQQSSRTLNTIRNSSFGIIEYCFTMVAAFVVRTFFIRYMAQEYLGFNGLFSNIISMFSLAEMGIGNALGFMLYGSLASNDEHKTRQIMAYYRKVYFAIAAVVLVIGLVLMPFLPQLIKEMPDVPESIYLIYILYVIDSVGSYLLAYKQAVISRDQKGYIISVGFTIYTLVMSIGQILVIVICQNFILYLVIQFVSRFLKNICLGLVSDKLYPYLKDNHEVLGKDDRQIIKNDTKALLLYRISGRVTSSTDNIIISRFIGLAAVGLYSNYYLVTHACYSLIKKGLSGISASAGNLYSHGERDAVEKLFCAGTFFAYWAYGFFSAVFFTVLDPFIKVWAGRNYVLDRPTVIIIIVNFFFMGLTESYGIFREAFGLFVQGRFRPVASSITNLGLSLIFVRFLGLFGVFLGTFVSYVAFNYWYDPFVIYKHAVKKSSRKFWIKSFIYLITTIILCVLSIAITYATTYELTGYMQIFTRCIEVTVLFNVMIIVLFWKTQEFKYIYTKLLSTIFKSVRKTIKK